MEKMLEGKVAIITGASAGIGAEMAELFAENGAKVVLFAIKEKDMHREERLDGIVQGIKDKGGDAISVIGDVTKQEDVDRLVDETIKAFGKIDIAVNNAGILDKFTPVDDLSDGLWDAVINVNLTGPMRIFRAVIPKMIENGGGSFVTVSSAGGISGKTSGAAYTASKHGVIGLAKNVAWMYGKDNIRSNVIAPGAVLSEMTTKMDLSKVHQDGRNRVLGVIDIVPGYSQPREIAELALFLASDKTPAVNGAVVAADSGWTI